jgi:two-component system, response regulator PdtaR
VEDEALIAEDLRHTVVLLGYAVVAVTDSGEDAVQRAGELRPDLVLLDYKLKGLMNGVEAGALIQQALSAAVVFVSANAEVLTQPYFVRKPFSRATLSRAITAALAAKQDPLL